MIMTTRRTAPADRSRKTGQGSKWCRPATRLAIYLRDGMACVYCGASVEDGATLSLDHLVPNAKGGSNDPSNLVCSCTRCNSSRGTRSVPAFAAAVASYLVERGQSAVAAEIVAQVRRTTRRALPRVEARELIARRGGLTNAIAAARR